MFLILLNSQIDSIFCRGLSIQYYYLCFKTELAREQCKTLVQIGLEKVRYAFDILKFIYFDSECIKECINFAILYFFFMLLQKHFWAVKLLQYLHMISLQIVLQMLLRSRWYLILFEDFFQFFFSLWSKYEKVEFHPKLKKVYSGVFNKFVFVMGIDFDKF